MNKDLEALRERMKLWGSEIQQKRVPMWFIHYSNSVSGISNLTSDEIGRLLDCYIKIGTGNPETDIPILDQEVERMVSERDQNKK